MKIIQKDCWGFWIFKRYSFILEDEEEGLTEVVVPKYIWENSSVGNYFDPDYDPQDD